MMRYFDLRGSETGPAEMAQYRILHVEDSSDDSELIRIALGDSPFGYSYRRVEDERGYLAELDAAVPDVILCDYDLPEFSAERALAIMRDRGLDVPFIIVSHHIGESHAVVAMQQGASDYLSKGNLDRLSKAIESAVDRRKDRVEKAIAQEELRASEAMRRSILNSLSSHIALIDGDGVILMVNKGWEEAGAPGARGGMLRGATGDNYLLLLEAGARSEQSDAAILSEGVRSVAARERRFFSHEYQVATGSSTRWYSVRVFPFEGGERGAVVSHKDITDRMMTHIAVERAHRRLQALSSRVLSVQEEERRKISRDLHDDIGQSLAALKIGLHRLGQTALAAGQAETVQECLAVASSTLEKLRDLALELRPPQLDQLGLSDALAWLVERQRNASGLDIRCSVSGVEEGFRPPLSLECACYRIVQEGLNNATRHANAKSILVSVERDGSLLRLVVRDDGIGFDEEAARQRALRGGSLGMMSMEERAELAGGRLKVRTAPGAGTVISVVFPLPEAKATVAEEDAMPIDT